MKMKISFDIDISDPDKAALAAALGCKPEQVETVLPGHALAALHEHVESYLGRRAFSRGSDILEHRLALLMHHAFADQIPNDARVSQLFQTTLSASRTLIRNALAKYRAQLGTASAASAKALLENVTWPGSGTDYHAKSPAPNLVEILNQRLLAEDPTKKSIARLPESVGTYAINIYSYDKLCTVFSAKKVDRT